MKKQFFSLLIIIIAALFTSCENETDTVKSGESSFDNVVIDPYQDLTLAIETVNSHYEGSYFTVCKLLGHKDIQTTQIYAEVIMPTRIEAVNRLSDFFGQG